MSGSPTQIIEMIDLTQGDEPVITYVANPRPALRELSRNQSSQRQRRGTVNRVDARRRATGFENLDDSYFNMLRQPSELIDENTSANPNISSRQRRVRRRREQFNEAIQGLGTRRPINPWIAHVQNFAKQNNISYRDALKNPKTKASYKKGGNIFNPLDGFKAGYKFGHDTLGPALFGKK